MILFLQLIKLISELLHLLLELSLVFIKGFVLSLRTRLIDLGFSRVGENANNYISADSFCLEEKTDLLRDLDYRATVAPVDHDGPLQVHLLYFLQFCNDELLGRFECVVRHLGNHVLHILNEILLTGEC